MEAASAGSGVQPLVQPWPRGQHSAGAVHLTFGVTEARMVPGSAATYRFHELRVDTVGARLFELVDQRVRRAVYHWHHANGRQFPRRRLTVHLGAAEDEHRTALAADGLAQRRQELEARLPLRIDLDQGATLHQRILRWQ